MKLRVSENTSFEMKVSLSTPTNGNYFLGCRGEEGCGKEEEGQEEGCRKEREGRAH